MTNEKIIHTVATVHNSVEKFVLYQKHNRTYVHTEKNVLHTEKTWSQFLTFTLQLSTFWCLIDKRC